MENQEYKYQEQMEVVHMDIWSFALKITEIHARRC